MTLKFHIPYVTIYGEELVLNVLTDAGTALKAGPYRMTTTDGREWMCALETEAKGVAIDYFYSVIYNGEPKRAEWKTIIHRLDLTAANGQQYILYDHWTDVPEDAYLYSSAFTDCINRQQPILPKETQYPTTVRLKVRAPQLHEGHTLTICGEASALGAWKPADGVKMQLHNYNEWTVDLDATAFKEGIIEFKFVANGELWETCDNRRVVLPQMNDGDVVCYDLGQSFYALPNRHFAGTLIPIFSLRSKGSFGVGDFGDLQQMIDFVSATGQRVLQVLPINDTTTSHTFTDSYPYSCISIFAIHPQYADLRQLPPLSDERQAAHFQVLQSELNALPDIDYVRVNTAKMEYLTLCFRQEGRRVLATKAYKAFFAENKEWLVPYACYGVLREHFGTAEFSSWPKQFQFWQAGIERKVKQIGDVRLYYYIQYILAKQLEAAHEHARELGVVLKGDIPIGVNRNGCDVWMEPKYFNLSGQAGAPPDDFSAEGQNWGFPTYNWETMLADGCRWWVKRFRAMQNYFDAYRIDHVLGFFRIWEIPISAVYGLLGQFSPALPMMREEIERYGIYFREKPFTQPYLQTSALRECFADETEDIINVYFDRADEMHWTFKAEYDTERKLEALDVSRELKGRLQRLVSDVLFVRDHKDTGKFHPRIAAQKTFAYRSLSPSEQSAFNRLYDDYYYHRNEGRWYEEAMSKLPLLTEATRMLVCAEDLGMVPQCVGCVMQQLRILSLEIQSMPKGTGHRFAYLPNNPYRSVSTISTHDMPTLRQWWDEDIDRAQDYFNAMLCHSGTAPHPLPGYLAREILYRHLTSPSLLCVISLQDWLAMDEGRRRVNADDERINIPANPKHYWRYRMHLTLEDMLSDDELKHEISDLVKQSGRD